MFAERFVLRCPRQLPGQREIVSLSLSLPVGPFEPESDFSSSRLLEPVEIVGWREMGISDGAVSSGRERHLGHSALTFGKVKY